MVDSKENYKFDLGVRGLNQSAVHAMLLYLLCFSHLMRNEQKNWQKKQKKNGWIISNLLYVLVCSIAEYFYTLFVF